MMLCGLLPHIVRSLTTQSEDMIQCEHWVCQGQFGPIATRVSNKGLDSKSIATIQLSHSGGCMKILKRPFLGRLWS
jgi:hypothetical protein